MPQCRRPSFANGYAASAEESDCPAFWEGLKGLWLPQLGNTGNKLLDVTGLHSPATWGGSTSLADRWKQTSNGVANSFTAANGDYWDCGAGPSKTLTSPMSLSVWFSFSSTPPQYSRIVSNLTGASKYKGYELYMNPGGADTKLYWQIGDGAYSTNGLGSKYTVFSLNPGWHCVTAWSSGTAMGMYWGGVVPGLTTDSAGTAVAASTSNFNIGRWSGGAGYGWNGKIWLVAVHSRVLTLHDHRLLLGDPLSVVRLRKRIFPAVAATTPPVTDSTSLPDGAITINSTGLTIGGKILTMGGGTPLAGIPYWIFTYRSRIFGGGVI